MSTSAINADQIMALDREYVMGTYMRQPIVFVRGRGGRLWDSEGNEYIDMLAGIAVCGVGHCHPRVVGAIQQQAAELLHISNLFHNPLQALLAERLCKLSGMEKAFFQNSGAEANECAIKIARKWAKQHKDPGCHEIITFHGSFHGRTMATVTATAQAKFQTPFAPMLPGFRYVEVGDVQGLDEAITEKTCAVMIEPIQGESGVKVIPPDFLRLIRDLCDESGILLIMDEVQTGHARTGHFLGSQAAGVQGDIVTLAKSVAAGVPMGVCLARGEAATTLAPGDHGSTFGGQPLACAAALAALDVIEEEHLLDRATQVGGAFMGMLQEVADDLPDLVAEVRGVGLMVGMELTQPVAGKLRAALLERRIIVNAVGDRILRFLPPLVVTLEDCKAVADAIRELLPTLEA